MMSADRVTVPALRLQQWLPDWDRVDFSAAHRRKPEPYMYLCGLPAGKLRALSGINRRATTERAASGVDLGIQRRHDPARSSEIRDFVRYGLPWSDMSPQKRAGEDLEVLRKPGFLPTAIVINVLTSEDVREDESVADSDLVRIEGEGDSVTMSFPDVTSGWLPSGPPPVEIIDGQHRLWAFEAGDDDFELPVVVYRGLDVAWQAYLFYTINVKPKRINTSLAFDLYPLLRTEDWLERADALAVYRETRAQELTEVLWRFPGSSWRGRIDMLGEHGRRMVSQAAWVRSLLASFIKASDGPRISIGGLYGAPVGARSMALPWSRPQQAALLIAAWRLLEIAVRDEDAAWTGSLRGGQETIPGDGMDPAFAGPSTLLNTDQGVRAYMQVVNDIAYVQADDLRLSEWADEQSVDEPTDEAVEESIRTLEGHPLFAMLRHLANALASYDWRTAGASGLDNETKQLKGRFRGSSGYRELRGDLLLHIAEHAEPPLRDVAEDARIRLGLA